jgi:PAS domain-containing protein
MRSKGCVVTAELGVLGAALLGSLPDPAAVLQRRDDRRVRLLHGNQALADLIGRSGDGPDAVDIDGLFEPDPDGRFLGRVHRAFDEQQEVAYEIVRERSFGRCVHLGAVTPVTAELAVLIERDVSDERRNSARLAELEALTQTGTWTWSLTDGSMHWSAELRRVAGVGLDLTAHIDAAFALVHPEDRDRLQRALDEVRATGSSEELRYRVVRPSGEQRTVCTRASRAVDQDGSALRVYGTMQDVTERAAFEAGEAARQRMVRQQERALQLNDDVIQSLARAWLALDLERPDEVRLAVTEGMATVRRMMTELLQASGTLGSPGRALPAGQLAHLRAARDEGHDELAGGPDHPPTT